MNLVLMKFGGTSVEDSAAIQRTAKIVQGRIGHAQRPVVVVSAMAKVTDQLLAAAKAAGLGDRADALAISSQLAAEASRYGRAAGSGGAHGRVHPLDSRPF